jgi:hypothetical protein
MNKPAVSTEKGARWAPEPEWTLERKENPLPLPGIGSQLEVMPVALRNRILI